MPKALGMVYTREGHGEEVLFLHGWGANKESFYYQTEFLKKYFTVTAVDFWGFGESDKLKKPYTVFDYASKLDCFLSLTGIKPYAIIAHSFGARVAIKLNYPSKKLIITGGAGIKPRRTIKYYCKTCTYKFLKALKIFDREKLVKKFASSDYAKLEGTMRQTFKNVVGEDLTPYLSDIKSETLLLWGKNDRETPLYMAKKMKNGIPNSGLVIIEDSGHFAFVDSPRVFNNIALKFLKP